MDNNKEFIMSLIKIGRLKGVDVSKVQNAIVYPPNVNLPLWHKHGRKQGIDETYVQYNPNTQFDYVTRESFVSDGTLYFTFDAMNRIFTRLASGSSWYVPAMENIDMENIRYKATYTIGDFIIIGYDDSVNCEKDEWRNWREQILLPVKFGIQECKKKKKGLNERLIKNE